jgi:hypothetical protein
LPGTPCFALFTKCAENSASNLLRTEIDGESSANSRAFNCEGISLSDGYTYKLKFQGRCVMSTILIILLAVVVVAFWVFDALHS